MIETLKTCIRTADFRPLRDVYDGASRLEAFLPIGTMVRKGRNEIIDLFTEWWPSEGTIVHWDAISYQEGFELVFERSPVEDERPWTCRHWHEIRVVDGRISKHRIWSDRPLHVQQLRPLPTPIAALVVGAERKPLYESGGASGSWMERITMPDGTRYVVKHISPQQDLLLRVTHDPGREAMLFASAALDRVADAIDSPIIAVAPEGKGWAILMRDVSASLLESGEGVESAGGGVSIGDRRKILRAVTRMHEAFRGESIDGACTITDRLRFLGPQVMGDEASGPDALPRWVCSSWEMFSELVPEDVAAAVRAIHADPSPLADQLTAAETTLIHGDLWAPNIGLAQRRIILLDWALACQAPREMEYAFWVLWNGGFMSASPDALLDDVRAVAGDSIDEPTLQLAFLGEFVSGAGAKGWAWNIVNHLDPARRERDRLELDWWVERARNVLHGVWSPI